MIKLYNSLTRKNEELTPIENNTIKMYSCGPTVYSFPHIGNMRAYVFMDTMRRVIKYNGYNLIGVMNLTDVGHLTSDGDDGDDKMELAAKKEQKTPLEIAAFYTNVFLNDAKKLNIDMPEYVKKATDYIPQMINIIKKLEEKGFTYIIDDGVYFDVKKFNEYGQLSNKDISKVGVARVEENKQKHHPFDFALWKFVPENHTMKWDSPWGVGCPGWHIECSAIGTDILGDHFDIHTGGVDHLPIHHENEIAQNNCAFGHKVVEKWVHNEFVLVDGGKMSKSLGNIYTISDLEKMGYDALAFKLFCLNSNYSKEINFTFNALQAAQTSLKNLRKLINDHKNGENFVSADVLNKYSNDFIEAINDNLNTPLALGILFSMLKNENKSKDVYKLALKFDEALGLNLSADVVSDEIPQEIKDLAEKRWQAKKQKDWANADALRNEINSKGYVILDGPNDYKIEKK